MIVQSPSPLKTAVSKENFGCDYADTGFFIFVIECLHENEIVRKTVFAYSYGAKVESFKPKKL